jgi:hypothetical protein
MVNEISPCSLLILRKMDSGNCQDRYWLGTLDDGNTDKCIWSATSNDIFIVKFAYLSLVTHENYPHFH